MSESKVCPICKQETEDMRHISVECMYNVGEEIPSLEKEIIFKEIPSNFPLFGYSRTYGNGFRDEFIINEERSKAKDATVIERIQKPMEKSSIRLAEKTQFRTNCCKNCRAEFIYQFKTFVEGKNNG